MTGRTVGIDFGTSTTLVAEGTPGRRPSVVPLGRTERWMPSVVSVRDGRLLVAEDALHEARPGRLIRSVKRCITENVSTVSSEDESLHREADDVILAVLKELS